MNISKVFSINSDRKNLCLIRSLNTDKIKFFVDESFEADEYAKNKMTTSNGLRN